jgi:hypothetical protein
VLMEGWGFLPQAVFCVFNISPRREGAKALNGLAQRRGYLGEYTRRAPPSRRVCSSRGVSSTVRWGCRVRSEAMSYCTTRIRRFDVRRCHSDTEQEPEPIKCVVRDQPGPPIEVVLCNPEQRNLREAATSQRFVWLSLRFAECTGSSESAEERGWARCTFEPWETGSDFLYWGWAVRGVSLLSARKVFGVLS